MEAATEHRERTCDMFRRSEGRERWSVMREAQTAPAALWSPNAVRFSNHVGLLPDSPCLLRLLSLSSCWLLSVGGPALLGLEKILILQSLALTSSPPSRRVSWVPLVTQHSLFACMWCFAFFN